MARVGQSPIEAPKYRLAPLCLSIPLAQFTDWLRKARVGDRIPYAAGTVLDARRDVVVAAREAQERGEVQLFQRRRTEGGYDYIARRVAAERAKPAPAPARPRGIDPETDLGRVLALLSRHANFALPCPSNRDIAVALRLNDARRVRYLIDQLRTDEVIYVVDRGPRVTRVVTIIASMKSTSAVRTPVGRGFIQGEAE